MPTNLTDHLALIDTNQQTTMNKDIMVTKSMIAAGDAIAGELVTANISYNLKGAGGSVEWDDYLKKNISNKDLILRYAKGEINSVEAIYLAMERERVK